MDLTWLTDERRYVATEGEAKKAGKAFEKRVVPTIKADLIRFMNELEDERERAIAVARAEGAAEASASTPSAPDPAPDPTPEPTPTKRAKTVVDERTTTDRVLDAGVDELPRILSAAIGRLGELAGAKGWAAFGRTVYGWTPGARSVEQGLGMLMLAAFDSFGMREPRTDDARDAAHAAAGAANDGEEADAQGSR